MKFIKISIPLVQIFVWRSSSGTKTLTYFRYVIWNDGIQKTCVVDDDGSCPMNKICVEESHLAQMLHHAHNHALICPETKDDICPDRPEDASGTSCSDEVMFFSGCCDIPHYF